MCHCFHELLTAVVCVVSNLVATVQEHDFIRAGGAADPDDDDDKDKDNSSDSDEDSQGSDAVARRARGEEDGGGGGSAAPGGEGEGEGETSRQMAALRAYLDDQVGSRVGLLIVYFVCSISVTLLLWEIKK